MAINKVILSGNLGADAEHRFTQGGTDALTFSIGTNEYTGKDKDPRVNWTRCTVFGKRAQALSQYLNKGTKVCVGGRLHTSSWDDNGTRRWSTEVIVDEIEFMSSRRPETHPQQEPQSAEAAVQDNFPGAEVTPYASSDIPF